jgi:hypothetical protein
MLVIVTIYRCERRNWSNCFISLSSWAGLQQWNCRLALRILPVTCSVLGAVDIPVSSCVYKTRNIRAGFVLLPCGFWRVFHVPDITQVCERVLRYSGFYETADAQQFIASQVCSPIKPLYAQQAAMDKSKLNIFISKNLIFLQTVQHSNRSAMNKTAELLLWLNSAEQLNQSMSRL